MEEPSSECRYAKRARKKETTIARESLPGIPEPIMVMTGSYDYRLVALSALLAILSSYAALDLAGRVTASRGWARGIWLASGAGAMGVGIWSMHYIGMLAFRMPLPISFYIPTVALSLLAAIAASAVGLFVVSRPTLSPLQQIVGSIIMGSGIAAMQYTGMAAMRIAALARYDRRIVAFSIVLAIAVSLVAIILSFGVRNEQRMSWRKIISALVMGSAIPLTHYTGMWAASFRQSDNAPDLRHSVGISTLGLVVIGIASILVIVAAIASSFLSRLLVSQKALVDTAREDESHFRAVAEAVPQILWTARPDGLRDFYNKRWYEYSGLDWARSEGEGWQPIMHPDDLAAYLRNWRQSLRTGETFEGEYRLRRALDGIYRWHLIRATAMRDAGGEIFKWCGTSTDIEDQKHNQQILEEQIKERTVELADTNTQLQEEMHERDVARRELDQQNDRMMRELTERSQRATLLAKMGELLQSCVNKDEVFSAALGFAPRIFPASRGAVALLNHTQNLVEVIGSWAECELLTTEFDPGSCWALRTGHPHLVIAGDSTARCTHASDVKNTYLCIPILAQGRALGILHFQTTDSSPSLSESELSFKTTFAAQMGLSIANIRLREALRSQSIKDPLTGLYNRRYLEEMLEREIRRAARSEQPLGVLMLDLDHFKSFNDTYGHDAGDVVLREAASFLVRSIRAEDIVCRYGGEEFVVILPTATLAATQSRAERLRSKIRELTVLHQGKSLGMITVSIGVAEFPEHGLSLKELLASSDAALYRAKREGRDRVVTAEPLTAVEVANSVAVSQQGSGHS